MSTLRILSLAALLLPLPAQQIGAPKGSLRDPNFRGVQGAVYLPDKTLAAGAIVKLKNLKTLQILSYITQQEGRYQFNNLSTDIDYELQAERGDLLSKRRGLSVFDRRAEAVVDLKLQPRKKGKHASANPAK